ncbi:MAG: S8 family serine peptidase, partial [Firmicutes bacterium]|nr:S8 family serine peptidase [Bacillota bacterium]
MELAEVIVRYYGSIEEAVGKLGGTAELLSESYAIVDIPEENIEKLRNEENIIYIELPKILALNYEVSGAQTERRYTENIYGLTGKGVIVGIIDSGIDYENRTFIDDNGKSRIIYIWDQSVEGNAPRGFERGYEYTNEDINNAISSGEKLEHTDTEGHGTAVAGICAGREGVAPESSIIMVKLGETGREYFGRSTELMR